MAKLAWLKKTTAPTEIKHAREAAQNRKDIAKKQRELKKIIDDAAAKCKHPVNLMCECKMQAAQDYIKAMGVPNA